MMNTLIHSCIRRLFPYLIASSLFPIPYSPFPFSGAARGDFDSIIDSPMYHLPDLPMPPVVTVYPEGLKELWLRALERPETDMRYKAAEAIGQAHRSGMKGLETTSAALIAALDRADQHPTVRLAIARALIVLEARESAPSLFRQAQAGSSDLRELAEPALARWDYPPAREIWLERLREPATQQRELILAIRGVAAVREERAADRLRELTLADRVPNSIRLESARAWGTLRREGLEKDAERLAAPPQGGEGLRGGGLVPRLAAASLLIRHSSREAVQLLQRLTRDSEPAVAAIAVARLLEMDPQLIVPDIEHLLARPDANLRSFAVDVLGRRPSGKHIRFLADRLDDPDIGVRAKARQYLKKLAGEKDWRDPVLAESTRMLQMQQWRGLEQAALLLTQLDHKPAAGRLVELLPFDRPEVRISAAWGLRKLDVPETLPGVLSFVESQVRRLSAEGARGQSADYLQAEYVDHALSQLNQFLGQRKYQPADKTLRWFIPRGRGKTEARASAIWALGLIHEGKTIDDLATALEERLNDIQSVPPEARPVRMMSAITLARMKAKKSLPSLRRFFPQGELTREPVENACGWAISQLTGETLRPGKPIRKAQRNWFLTPYSPN